jgi:drug/metabolite transporter (DMT)-like permease
MPSLDNPPGISAPPAWKTIGAFAIIYIVWGSTFLAIRVGVQQVPPLLFAAMRFASAGLLLYLWQRIRGDRNPTRRQGLSILLLSTLIFAVNYGLLFWAEQRVPSGVASIMLATIPAFTALAEILILHTQRLTARFALALLIGLGGVAVLVSPGFHIAQTSLVQKPVDHRGAIALLLAAIAWSTASVLTRKLELPASRGMSAAAQMLTGGILLFLLALPFGEFQRFHVSAISLHVWLALAYLIVFGSLIGFSAYMWLIHHQSPTRVGTYAYVNPVVAVLLGYFFGGEALGARTIVGALCVLLSVIVITATQKPATKTLPTFTAETETL